jgi:hypothetical protein
MARKKFELQEGQIVVLTDGRVFRVRENYGDNLCVIWMDADEETFICDKDSLHVESVLEPSPEVLLTFNATRSLHERLNRLSRV